MPEVRHDALEWRGQLDQALTHTLREGHTELVVPYRSVANAFPGGFHPQFVDTQLIDLDALRTWAHKMGWEFRTSPETAHPDLETTPQIRFISVSA